MKRFIFIIVLILNLQTWTKADDIRDFEIEGMSIEDSLLDFYEENEINKNYYPQSNKFYYSWFTINNSNKYSEIQVVMKNNDKEYIIQSLRAGKPYKIDQCLKEKNILEKEVENILGDSISSNSYPKYKHSNSYPNSFVHTTQFEFKNNDLIRIFCMDWSNKTEDEKGWQDNLSIEIQKAQYRTFLTDEAYE